MLAILIVMFASTVVDFSYLLRELLSNFEAVKTLVQFQADLYITATVLNFDNAGPGSIIPFSVNVDWF